MAAKEFIGLALDGNRVYAARVKKVKGALELSGVKTLVLPKPLEQVSSLQESEAGEEPVDDIFNLDEDSGRVESVDPEAEHDKEESDQLDISGEEFPDSTEEEANDQVLAEYFNSLGNRKLQIAINIPQGKTVFQPLQNVRPGKMKKKERAEFFSSKLAPIYNEKITPEQYTWEEGESGDGWLVSYDNDTGFLNLIDLADTSYNGSVLFRDMLSDEVIWTGMVRTHYDLSEDEITGLISIGEHATRLVFLKGKQILQVMPVIGEGSKNRNILQTIFSKLLFEIDKGTFTSLHRLIIMQSTGLGESARDFFKEKFADIKVDLFQPDPEKLILPEDLKQEPGTLNTYITAIGAAQAAAGVGTDQWPSLSLLPDYIREKQRVFKLEWHGMILLALIAFTPLLINNWYQDYSSRQEALTREIELSDSRISELQPIVAEVEQLTEEQLILQELNDRITELSRQNLLWSETLNQFNQGMTEIPNTWITTLQVSGDDLNIQGYSLYRERISRVGEIFDDAHIFQVTEGSMRGATVYHFTLRVNNFRTEDERFNPEIPQPDVEDIPETRELQQLE